MKHLYDITIRLPVFAGDDGRKTAVPTTVLPESWPGAPLAVTHEPRNSLDAAVQGLREFCTANEITILEH